MQTKFLVKKLPRYGIFMTRLPTIWYQSYRTSHPSKNAIIPFSKLLTPRPQGGWSLSTSYGSGDGTAQKPHGVITFSIRTFPPTRQFHSCNNIYIFFYISHPTIPENSQTTSR